MTTKRWTTSYAIALITLLGAALRLWNLGGQSLWLDEVFTARVAPLDVAGILAAIRMDLDTPPLHPFVVHAFLALGQNDFVLRLPSALASIISVPLMYVVGRRLLGWHSGLLAALLLAVSPFAVYFAQEARMYGLLLMFALLTLYCLLRAINLHPNPLPKGKRETAAPWLGFVLSATLGLYTHFFGFFILGVAVLYATLRLAACWRAGERSGACRQAAYLVVSLVAVAALYAPWLPTLLNFLRENYAANPYGQSWQANLRPETMGNMLTLMLGGYWAHPLARWATRALLLIGWLVMARRRPLPAALAALTVGVPFAVVSVLNPGHFVTERYFIFMLPMLMLCVAEGLLVLGDLSAAVAIGVVGRLHRSSVLLRSRGASLALLAACLAVPLFSASGLERYFLDPPKPEWRLLARFVAGTVPTGDLIIVATFPHWDKEPLQHYLKMGGRRVVYAAEERNLRQILAEERSHPWWILYAGTERRLDRAMRSAGVESPFTVIPFNYLAVVRRTGGTVDAVDDGRIILKALRPRIPPPYQGEVQRVIAGLASPSGDMGTPILPPAPTTVR